MSRAAGIRRLALAAAVGFAGLALIAFVWSLLAVFGRLSSPELSMAIGLVGVGGFTAAFLITYVIDTRRHSRQLRSAASYSRLSAERTRALVTSSKRVAHLAQLLVDRPLPPSMAYLDQRFLQLADAFSAHVAALHDQIAAAADQVLDRANDLSQVVLSANSQTSGGQPHALSLELDKAIDRLYALGEGLLATYTLRPSAPLAPMRGWAISPDLSALLVYLIAAERPTTIIEMGSGVSTAIMGLALSQAGTGRLISLEHDPEYAAKTEAMLRVHGIDHLVDVVRAPLVEHEVNGQTVLWYDMSAVDLDGPIDLIVIDGPPKTSGPRARYPALHILKEHIQPGTVIVVDDANRKEEVEMISSWNEEVRPLSVEFLPHEKGTAVIRIPE